MKSFFVSDVHLGSSFDKAINDTTECRFLRWLDYAHSERARVFLLGDIFDFWYEYNGVIPAAHSAVLGRLKMMVADGIEIHFFKGNHDMWLRTYLRDEIGLIIHDRSEVMDIDGEKVFIGHGHDLCFKRSFMTRLLWILFNTKFFYNLFSIIIHPNLMMAIGKRWSCGSRSNKSVSHVFRGEDEYITNYINSRLEMFSSLGVSKFIFGHFHCPTLYRLGDGVSELMILGEWSENNIHYGILDKDVFELKKQSVNSLS